MKDNSYGQMHHRDEKLRPTAKKFVLPYGQPIGMKQTAATIPLKKQYAVIDKENCRMQDQKPQRKKTTSPQRKKQSVRKKTKKPNLNYFNKTEEVRKLLQNRTAKVTPSSSYADITKGKSAELKRHRRLQDWQDKEYRQLSLSLKKRSQSKQLCRMVYQDPRERSRGKRPSTELTKHLNTTLRGDTIPLMRDILKQIKKQNQKSRNLKKPRNRKESVDTALIRPNIHTKTVNTAPSKPKFKRRISTVIEDFQQPESLSNIFNRQSTQQNCVITAQSSDIAQVLLTQADQFDLEQLRQFQYRFSHKEPRPYDSRHITKIISQEHEEQMARKIQRWWRRQMTKKIVKQFIKRTRVYSQVSEQPESKGLDLIELNFYEESIRKVTYISNLSEEQEKKEQVPVEIPEVPKQKSSQPTEYELMMNKMKQRQLDKLNDFISLIKNSLSSGKSHKQQLLKKLVQQSENNCKSLQKQADFPKKEVQERYEQFDGDYVSNGGESEKQIKTEEQEVKVFQGTLDNKRPMTPTLEAQRLVIGTDNSRPINRPRFRSPKIEDDASSQSSNHELMPYIHEQLDEDPLLSLQAAQKLRKKLEQLNSRPFESEHLNQIDVVSEDEFHSPRLKRQTNMPLHKLSQQNQDEQSDSSSEWEMFPILQKLIKLLPDREKLTDDVSHMLLQKLITQFLKDISNGKLLEAFNAYTLKNKEKKVVVVKKTVTKKARGIKTNVAAVKEYLKGFSLYLIDRKPEVLNKLNEPTGPSARELLKYMHAYGQSSETEDDSSILVLPVSLFQEYWDQFEKGIGQGAEQTQTQQMKRLANMHCRAIFDCFNENLNSQRNYGEFGKPFPWKNAPNFQKKACLPQYKIALQNAYIKTIETCTSYCGIIFDKQDSPPGPLPTKQQIQQMHEDRLSRSLALELFELQKNWVFYDDEQTEILVELSHVVGDFLMREFQNQLMRIYRIRSFL